MAVKFIHPFKAYMPGDVATLHADSEAWLISRQYAVDCTDEVPPPMQAGPPQKPLTTRGKKGK